MPHESLGRVYVPHEGRAKISLPADAAYVQLLEPRSRKLDKSRGRY
jgi:hypothetical protein